MLRDREATIGTGEPKEKRPLILTGFTVDELEAEAKLGTESVSSGRGGWVNNVRITREIAFYREEGSVRIKFLDEERDGEGRLTRKAMSFRRHDFKNRAEYEAHQEQAGIGNITTSSIADAIKQVRRTTVK